MDLLVMVSLQVVVVKGPAEVVGNTSGGGGGDGIGGGGGEGTSGGGGEGTSGGGGDTNGAGGGDGIGGGGEGTSGGRGGDGDEGGGDGTKGGCTAGGGDGDKRKVEEEEEKALEEAMVELSSQEGRVLVRAEMDCLARGELGKAIGHRFQIGTEITGHSWMIPLIFCSVYHHLCCVCHCHCHCHFCEVWLPRVPQLAREVLKEPESLHLLSSSLIFSLLSVCLKMGYQSASSHLSILT
ncbi:hypothetical protein OIU79_009833 [Salix purpurea]|uniref:Uncharacterized protein n=1 Tax=Salix purpurea TaxID=77065 RepID=A0A9Q0T8K3_SALPP|nr:hypothetical protein OIU79_009833 [Salix purpurea]